MNYAYFHWSYYECPPIGKIADVIRWHPDWKLYTLEPFSDFTELIMAKNLRSAKAGYRDVNKQLIKELKKDDGEDFVMPEIYEWQD